MSESKFEKMCNAVTKYASNHIGCSNGPETEQWLRDNSDEAISYLFEKENQRITHRSKILAFSVAARLNVDECNNLLRKYRTEALYIRNLSDCATIRILQTGGNANELCRLVEIIAPFADCLPNDKFFIKESGYFVCTIERMRAYLDNSRDSDSFKRLVTRQITKELSCKFDDVSTRSEDDFIKIIEDNIESFTAIRERTRRELIRYLLIYAENIKDKGDDNTKEKLFMNSGDEKWTLNFRQLAIELDVFFMEKMLNHNNMNITDDADLFDMCDEEYRKAIIKLSTVITNFIKGENDMSRTLFLSIILFIRVKCGNDISLQTLNSSLNRCGWRQIDIASPEDIFDFLFNCVINPLEDMDEQMEEFSDMLLYDEDDTFVKYEGDYANHPVAEESAKMLIRSR